MYIASVLTLCQLSAHMIGTIFRYKILFYILLDDWLGYSMQVIVLMLQPQCSVFNQQYVQELSLLDWLIKTKQLKVSTENKRLLLCILL